MARLESEENDFHFAANYDHKYGEYIVFTILWQKWKNYAMCQFKIEQHVRHFAG